MPLGHVPSDDWQTTDSKRCSSLLKTGQFPVKMLFHQIISDREIYRHKYSTFNTVAQKITQWSYTGVKIPALHLFDKMKSANS